MKKVLLMLLFGILVLGAKFAMADAKLASEEGDARLIDDVDLLFLGYVNKVNDYKDMVDFRLNNYNGDFGGGTSEWGGVIDGKHGDLGVIGVYVNRPFAPHIYNGEPATWTPTGGQANWSLNSVSSNLGGFTNPVGGFRGGYTNANVPTPNNKVDIFWGKSSDSGNFGIGINYGDNTPTTWPNYSDAYSDATPNTYNLTGTVDARTLGLSIGLGFKNVGSFDELDIHGGYSYGTFTDSLVKSYTGAGTGNNGAYNENTKDNGIYTITLGALAQHNIDQDSNMRLFLDGVLNQFNATSSIQTNTDNLGFNDFATDANAYDTEYGIDTNSLNVALGLGCNHKVNDGAAVFSSGLVASYTSNQQKGNETTQNGGPVQIVDLSTDEWDGTTLDLLWNGSVDAKVASWLNIRAGLAEHIFDRTSNKYINNITTAPVGTQTYQYNGDAFAGATSFSLGFGIHWQNWMLDTNVTASSFENSVANVVPGNGLFFANANGNASNAIVTVAEADLKYGF
jgi:hypothetical protein